MGGHTLMKISVTAEDIQFNDLQIGRLATQPVG